MQQPNGSLHELTEYPLIREVGSPLPIIDLTDVIPGGTRPVVWMDEAAEMYRIYAVPYGHAIVDRQTHQAYDETPPS